jgi:hypothetical protein
VGSRGNRAEAAHRRGFFRPRMLAEATRATPVARRGRRRSANRAPHVFPKACNLEAQVAHCVSSLEVHSKQSRRRRLGRTEQPLGSGRLRLGSSPAGKSRWRGRGNPQYRSAARCGTFAHSSPTSRESGETVRLEISWTEFAPGPRDLPEGRNLKRLKGVTEARCQVFTGRLAFP